MTPSPLRCPCVPVATVSIDTQTICVCIVGSPETPPVPVVEVVEDAAEWLSYLGQWGTTPSPATQRWFLNAEPAVSRTVLQRVLHFPSERVADGKPKVPAKKS